MKLPESAAFKLFDKHNIAHPKIGVKSGKVVIKADLPLGGKKKAGLVQICDASEAVAVAKKMAVPTIIEKFFPHEKEYFIAIRPTRDGLEVLYSPSGGVDIESNWQSVSRKPDSSLQPLVNQLEDFFNSEDATYLEINPFTIIKGKPMPLGVVLELDDAAAFRHPDWDFPEVKNQTPREQAVTLIDSEIKGSIKLVEVPAGGDTAVMGGGAGAVLFLCDAVINHGYKLANYAEFSGNPPAFAVAELTKNVCAIPGIKNLVIGSGIANFTDVQSNIDGIIAGLKASPAAKNLRIVVRRCGPGEEEAAALMRNFAKDSGLNIQVFGRETGMTEICKYLKPS